MLVAKLLATTQCQRISREEKKKAKKERRRKKKEEERRKGIKIGKRKGVMDMCLAAIIFSANIVTTLSSLIDKSEYDIKEVKEMRRRRGEVEERKRGYHCSHISSRSLLYERSFDIKIRSQRSSTPSGIRKT